MSAAKLLAASVCIFLIAVCGCKQPGSTASTTATAAPGKSLARIDAATAGTLSGVVHFDGPAPRRVEIDMAQDPACAMSGGSNFSEESVVEGGKLANVYLYISQGLGDKIYAPASTAVVLDQKGCRYLPHVIAAQAGQPVEFRNSDPTMHNVHMEPAAGGNQSVDISQAPMGGTTRRVFNKPETLIPVRCNNHPWMQAYINVASSPFFAVSDASGHYTLTGLPPGTYTVTAVHEKYGSLQETATVTSGGKAVSDFHFSPKSQ